MNSSNTFDTVNCDKNYYVHQNKTPGDPCTAKFVKSAVAILKTYVDSIMISQPSAPGNFQHLRPAIDAHEIIFSLQEIVKFHEAYYTQENRDQIYSGILAVHHAAENYLNPPGSATDSTMQHSVFFVQKDWKYSPYGILPFKAVVLAAGDGVNLAHLCPPSCDALKFP
jgi:hypothetical protein